MSWLKKLVCAAAVLSLWGRTGLADSIWIGENPAEAIQVDGVKIHDAKGDDLAYLTEAGSETSKPLAKLARINIDGAAAFNAAEDAYFSKNYDTAITAYQKLLDGAGKDWMRKRAATRLIAMGKLKNRFDAEVSAYVYLVKNDPAAAAQNKPTEPTATTPGLDTALSSIARGMDANLNATQSSLLLNLQLQIDQARGDDTQVQSTLQQLVKLGGGTDEMKATIKIDDARVALKARHYDQAVDDIEQNRTLFTDPDQQVDALFILAEAKFAVDGEKSDPDVLKDLALNYMRVVTFGGQLPDHPHVAESLDKAAELEKKLNDNAGALQLFQQLSNEKSAEGTPLASKAQTEIAQLTKKTAAK